MSAPTQSLSLHADYPIVLSTDLSAADRHTATTLLSTLLEDNAASEVRVNDDVNKAIDSSSGIIDIAGITIKKVVDGRDLACPMPLLKTKVALRDISAGEALYVVATDPNSRADITAFCQQAKITAHSGIGDTLQLVVNQKTTKVTTDLNAREKLDTIFHFIITKTDSN